MMRYQCDTHCTVPYSTLAHLRNLKALALPQEHVPQGTRTSWKRTSACPWGPSSNPNTWRGRTTRTPADATGTSTIDCCSWAEDAQGAPLLPALPPPLPAARGGRERGEGGGEEGWPWFPLCFP